MGIKFDNLKMEAIRINSQFMKTQLMKLGRDYVSIIILMTILKHNEYQVFEEEVCNEIRGPILLSHFLSWRHLVNNFLTACKLHFCFQPATATAIVSSTISC